MSLNHTFLTIWIHPTISSCSGCSCFFEHGSQIRGVGRHLEHVPVFVHMREEGSQARASELFASQLLKQNKRASSPHPVPPSLCVSYCIKLRSLYAHVWGEGLSTAWSHCARASCNHGCELQGNMMLVWTLTTNTPGAFTYWSEIGVHVHARAHTRVEMVRFALLSRLLL